MSSWETLFDHSFNMHIPAVDASSSDTSGYYASALPPADISPVYTVPDNTYRPEDSIYARLRDSFERGLQPLLHNLPPLPVEVIESMTSTLEIFARSPTEGEVRCHQLFGITVAIAIQIVATIYAAAGNPVVIQPLTPEGRYGLEDDLNLLVQCANGTSITISIGMKRPAFLLNHAHLLNKRTDLNLLERSTGCEAMAIKVQIKVTRFRQ